MKFNEFKENKKQVDLIQVFRDFFPVAMSELKIKKLPKIRLEKYLEQDDQPSFGRFVHSKDHAEIHLAIKDRHPIDIIRTLAHELVHFKQYTEDRLNKNSGKTGSPDENEAHIVAGVIMRNFDKKFPGYFKNSSITLDEGKTAPSSKQKKLASALEDYANKHIPKSDQGFGDFMYHAELIRKGHQDIHKQDLNTVQSKYRKIMNDMIKQHLDENFKDGRNPQDKGDSKRHNVPTKASVSTLRKVAKGGGRRGQLAHWMANMKSGRKKAKEEYATGPKAQVHGKDPMPKAKPGRTNHPFHGKLVGGT